VKASPAAARGIRFALAILGAALVHSAMVVSLAGERKPSDRVEALGGGTADRPEGEAALERRIEEHDSRLARRVMGLWGVGISEEQVIAASLGLIVAPLPVDFDCRTTCEYRGPAVKLEPGLGAVKLSAGFAALVGERRRSERFISHVYFGYGLNGVLMHTWSDRSSEPPGETWVGVEGEVTAVMVNFSLGLLGNVSGSDDDLLVTAGIGWGF
jgi:hypothetical protein